MEKASFCQRAAASPDQACSISAKIDRVVHSGQLYELELAQAFNEFYHLCPVLQVDDATKRARLVLISGVKQVQRNGLGLLGIQVLEEM